MMPLDALFDGLLGLTLLWLAVRVVFTRELFSAVVTFIALGMLMALAWLRLATPDIALAEAVLGSGVTGALLLAALNRLESRTAEAGMPLSRPERYRPLLMVLAVAAVTGIAGLLIWALQPLPPMASGLSALVRESLPLSGVRAEVTAVLLNFRGYDTLLELAVLLASLLGVWHAGRMELVHRYHQPSPVLDTLIRLLVPITVVVTGYVLWLGSHAAGGAFQAGALLAGAGILLVVTNEFRLQQDRAGIRALLVVGPAVFALVAGTLLFIEGTLLQYPPASAGGLILLIEAASVISIGLILTLLFVGGRLPGGDRP